MLKLLSVLILVLGTIVPGLRAQTAMLTGVVKDSVTLEALISANISLAGTLQGAATSTEGTFVIRKIPPGSYVLRISLIGYAAREFPVNLAVNDSLFIELYLQPEHVEEEEVVVDTLQRRNAIE